MERNANYEGITMKYVLTLAIGIIIGLLFNGVYVMGELPGWRINRITGEQRVCSMFTGEMKCQVIP